VRQAFLIKVGGRVAVIRAHTNGVLLERVQPARNSRWHVFRFVSSADVSLHERHSPS
jgi:hypothetical protein